MGILRCNVSFQGLNRFKFGLFLGMAKRPGFLLCAQLGIEWMKQKDMRQIVERRVHSATCSSKQLLNLSCRFAFLWMFLVAEASSFSSCASFSRCLLFSLSLLQVEFFCRLAAVKGGKGISGAFIAVVSKTKYPLFHISHSAILLVAGVMRKNSIPNRDFKNVACCS